MFLWIEPPFYRQPPIWPFTTSNRTLLTLFFDNIAPNEIWDKRKNKCTSES